MELHHLKPAQGSTRTNRRLARGQGSGTGGTATRGTKGNGSRAGFKNKRKHEGGQTPLQQRLPKRGFKNSHPRYQSFNATEYVAVNIALLEHYAETHNTTVFDAEVLHKVGCVAKNEKFKVLATGEPTKALQVSAYRFSGAAKEAISKAGGKAFYIFKLSQIQGLVDKYHLKFVTPKTIATYFDHVQETDLIHVIEEGDLTLKFDLSVHKISAQAQKQVQAKGGTVTIL
jgi:large subunit ribosomal protein L15